MKQISLFKPEDLPPRILYEKLFENLPALSPDEKRMGRPPFSRDFLLKALIYKALRRIHSLTDLIFEFKNNPSTLAVCSGDLLSRIPSVERISSFLRDTPNQRLRRVRDTLVDALIRQGVITAREVALDSCPIPAHVKENNLKTSVKDRFEKERRPKGDPEAALGIMADYSKSSRKKIRYFWGYRNHTIVCAETELSLWERTLPANKSEIPQAISMLKELIDKHPSLIIQAVLGDAMYDTEDILKFIIKDLKAKAGIPHNPRGKKKEGFYVQKNKVYCPADIAMMRKGKMTVRGITYLQYTCPLHWSKRIRQRYLLCPANHPKFFKQKGCNYLIRLTPSIREEIDYGSKEFKSFHNKRTSIERCFSRLLSITMQNPTTVGLNATRNHCTIAHITSSLVALTACRSGQRDKIRFIKYFVNDLMDEGRKGEGEEKIYRHD